jgi:hypothetical protein
MPRFDLIAPFIAAIMFYAISPLLCLQTKSAVRRVIESGAKHVGSPQDGNIPYYLTVESIDDYIDFAMDAVQVFPAFLLPIVGSIYTFSSATPSGLSVCLLLASFVLAIGMSAWITSTAPADYVSRKWRGYSLISIFGVAFNAAAISFVLLLS